jgi:hypothetical protein
MKYKHAPEPDVEIREKEMGPISTSSLMTSAIWNDVAVNK